MPITRMWDRSWSSTLESYKRNITSTEPIVFASFNPNCWLSSQLLNFNPSHNLLKATQEQLLPQFRTKLEITMEPAPLANDRSRLPRTQLSLNTRALPKGNQMTIAHCNHSDDSAAWSSAPPHSELWRRLYEVPPVKPPRQGSGDMATRKTDLEQECALAKMAMPGAAVQAWVWHIQFLLSQFVSEFADCLASVRTGLPSISTWTSRSRLLSLPLSFFLLPSCLSTCNDIESCPNLALHTQIKGAHAPHKGEGILSSETFKPACSKITVSCA